MAQGVAFLLTPETRHRPLGRLRRRRHAELRVLLREVQEGSGPDAHDQRARAWRLQVSGLRREDAEAADGRVLLEDLAEVLALIGVRSCIDALPGRALRRLDARVDQMSDCKT